MGNVSYSISGKPSWAAFNAATGKLSGTPGTSNEGKSASITISASNGVSRASLAPFSIQVTVPTATTGSATLSWDAPTQNTNGTPVTNLAGYHIYYSLEKTSPTKTVTITDPTSTTYTIRGLTQGTYYFSVVAYNSLDIDSSDSNTASANIS